MKKQGKTAFRLQKMGVRPKGQTSRIYSCYSLPFDSQHAINQVFGGRNPTQVSYSGILELFKIPILRLHFLTKLVFTTLR